MKKKILAVFLSLCMAMSLLPVTALAAENGTAVTADTTELKSGSYYVSNDIKLNHSLTIPEGETVNLDLRGQTLTLQQLLVNGSLTIYDSQSDGQITSTITDKNTGAIKVGTAGLLTLKSGTISSPGYGVYVFDGGKTIVNGGMITSFYAPLAGNNTAGDMNFEVNGGTLTASYGPAIYMPGQVSLKITDGTLNGGISLRMGQVDISGGTINAITDNIDPITGYYNYSGNAWLADALYVFNGTYTSENVSYGNSLNLNITGGTFNCMNDQGSAVAIYDLGKVAQNSQVNISGDAVLNSSVGDRGAYQVLSLADVEVTEPAEGYGKEEYVGKVSTTITGGTFSSEPDADYIATGYAATENDAGKYVVGPKDGGALEVKPSTDSGKTSATLEGYYQNADTDITEGEGGTGSEVSTTGVTVDLTSAEPATTTGTVELTVNADTANSLANNSANSLVVKSDVGTVKLDSAALDELATVTEPVVISIKATDTDQSNPTWEVTVKEGKNELFAKTTDVGITITVPAPTGATAGNTKVYCIDNGGMEDMNAELKDGSLTWTTKHLSTFAAVVLSGETEAIWSVDGKTPTSGSGTLADAIAAFTDGTTGTITLQKDVVADNSSIKDATQSVYKIPNGVTLDGNNKTIKASENWKGDSGRTTNHILSVESNGGTVTTAQTTIKNLTIIGTKTSKSGIHAYNGANVKLDNVKIQNCGSVGVQINGAKVEATGLNISGSGWGSINVDKGTNVTTAATLTFNSGKLEDDVQIYSEDNSNSTITATELIRVNGGDGALAGKTYYTDDVTKLGEAFNTSTKTVYKDLDTALSEANAGDTVRVVKDATADGPNTSVKEGVTLVVNPGVKLKGDLTNNGTIDNKGTITGNVTGAGNLTTEVTFQVTPSNATVTVRDNKGDVVTGTNNVYQLPNGNYTYTVSANGYFSESGTITVSGKVQTISVTLSKVPPANPNYRIDIPDFEGGTVTADPAAAKAGAKVTLTATPDEGYAVGTITVTDRFGDAVKVTENADGTYTFTMPNGQVTVKATFVETEEPAPAEPFPDVDENDWFYDEVVYVYENGLMNGVENNQFAPNTATNRAMLATILYRLAGQPDVSGDLPFTDVAAGQWYTDAVLWAAQNGIVNGLGENTFAPMNTLTREQLVTMLYRYAEAEGYDVSAAADLSGYPDAGKVQPYAQEAMTWAVAEGIVEGMDGNLNPAGHATRAQIATILMRFCEGVAK